jgi:hypothetical protein
VPDLPRGDSHADLKQAYDIEHDTHQELCASVFNSPRERALDEAAPVDMVHIQERIDSEQGHLDATDQGHGSLDIGHTSDTCEDMGHTAGTHARMDRGELARSLCRDVSDIDTCIDSDHGQVHLFQKRGSDDDGEASNAHAHIAREDLVRRFLGPLTSEHPQAAAHAHEENTSLNLSPGNTNVPGLHGDLHCAEDDNVPRDGLSLSRSLSAVHARRAGEAASYGREQLNVAALQPVVAVPAQSNSPDNHSRHTPEGGIEAQTGTPDSRFMHGLDSNLL